MQPCCAKKMVIAVDGPSASGKGSLARRLAAQFGFAYLDTGLLYRAVGIAVLRHGGDPSDPIAAEKAALALDPISLFKDAESGELRTPEASQAASKCSAIAPVRAALLKFQRDFAEKPPEEARGAVLDGRDIGTVIAPEAPLKLFITASPEVRAHRRFLELKTRGGGLSEAQVLEEMQERDARDANRAVVPTRPAEDAILLDTSELSAEAVFQMALALCKERLDL